METVNCIRCDFRHKDNGNCTAVGGFCTAVPAAHCPMLRMYLDTGLTPEKVNDVVVGAKLMAKAKVVSAFGVAAERLLELAEADKEGRVVVLPCKVGDTVYRLQYVEESPGRFIVDAVPIKFALVWLDEFGKTVFFTREEAKAALEAMK